MTEFTDKTTTFESTRQDRVRLLPRRRKVTAAPLDEPELSHEELGTQADGAVGVSDESVDGPVDGNTDGSAGTRLRRRKRSESRWLRAATYAVLPTLAVILTSGAAYLKYYQSSMASDQAAGSASVAAAKDIAGQMLAYTPDTAAKTLTAAGDRMTGSFRDSFLKLVNEVVVPGAREKSVSATVTVPAAAVVSATPKDATVVLFIDQTITVAGGPPTNTASVVEMTLRNDQGRWLATGFEPK